MQPIKRQGPPCSRSKSLTHLPLTEHSSKTQNLHNQFRPTSFQLRDHEILNRSKDISREAGDGATKIDPWTLYCLWQLLYACCSRRAMLELWLYELILYSPLPLQLIQGSAFYLPRYDVLVWGQGIHYGAFGSGHSNRSICAGRDDIRGSAGPKHAALVIVLYDVQEAYIFKLIIYSRSSCAVSKMCIVGLTNAEDRVPKCCSCKVKPYQFPMRSFDLIYPKYVSDAFNIPDDSISLNFWVVRMPGLP